MVSRAWQFRKARKRQGNLVRSGVYAMTAGGVVSILGAVFFGSSLIDYTYPFAMIPGLLLIVGSIGFFDLYYVNISMQRRPEKRPPGVALVFLLGRGSAFTVVFFHFLIIAMRDYVL